MNAHIVVGLGYGDEGKGSWVDHLVRKHDVKYVVRFNGGAQASHHVVTPDDRVHGFHQLSSGSFVEGVHTLLSRFMLLDPDHLLAEASELEQQGVFQPLTRVLAHRDAPIITPFNRILNQMQEIHRGGSRHGSCGFGIGITQNDVETLGSDTLYLRDLLTDTLRPKLLRLWELKVQEASVVRSTETESLFGKLNSTDVDYYVDLFRHVARRITVIDDDEFNAIVRTNDSVWEGAQGVLLDQTDGFFPHCTRSTCTFQNALTLLQEANFSGTTVRIGLLRGYATRHGAGPFVTEDSECNVSACHNLTNPWQGHFRTGWFDCVTARFALNVVGGVDVLAVTNLDRLYERAEVKIATEYDGLKPQFGTSRTLLRLPFDKKVLENRSEALKQVTPRYTRVEGFTKDSASLRYLDLLEEHISHRIHAVSDTPKHQKLYR